MRLVTLLVVLLAAATVHAQSRADRAYVSETLLGGANRGSSTEVGIGTPPLALADHFMIGASLYGRRTVLDNADPARPGNFVGNDLQLGLLLLAPLNERWSLTAVPVVAGRFTTDAHFRAPRDLTFNAIALANYAIGGNRDYVVSFGLLFTNTLPFSPVIPIAGLRYTDEHWRLEATWPQPQAVRRFGDRFEAGLAMRFDYPLYRIRSIPAGSETAEYARLTNHYFSAVLAMRLVANLWLAAKPGIDVGRVVRLVDHDRDNVDAGKQSLDLAPSLTLILSWRAARR
jgi:hypothetical protein